MNTPVHQLKNGKYKWTYDVPLLRNWSLLFLVYKVLFLSGFITFFMVACIGTCEDGVDGLKSVVPTPKVLLIVVAVILLMGLLGYLLYAAVMGWKYSAEFTMDDLQLEHKQIRQQERKAKKLSMATVLVGLLSRRPGAVSAGVMSSVHTTTVTTFISVKRIVAVRRYHMIKVNERFTKNRIYVDDADYDFVLNFIKQHCPHASCKD